MLLKVIQNDDSTTDSDDSEGASDSEVMKENKPECHDIEITECYSSETITTDSKKVSRSSICFVF